MRSAAYAFAMTVLSTMKRATPGLAARNRSPAGVAARGVRALSSSGAKLSRSSGRQSPCSCALRGQGSKHTAATTTALRAVSTGAEKETDGETFEYQAEVNRLMDLIVNSLYSNKDVFLRELVSNASDALDKVRFLSIKDPSVLGDVSDLKIEVKADKEAKTVTITDTGVGMTKAELLESLGTIARSGTSQFMEAIKQSQDGAGDTSLIGQFGVGFYSSFLVADKVRVQTKAAGEDKQFVWESAIGSVSYTVKEDDAQDLGRGTRITLFLKEDALEYADHMKLRDLIQQYSEFIGFPINLWTTKTVTKQVVDEEATKKAKEEAEKDKKEGDEAAEVEPVMKTDYDTVWDWSVQNENKPLWLQSARDLEKSDYDGFFKTTFKEFMDPLAYNHFNVEGTYEFSGIVFIPGMAPFDQHPVDMAKNIRLYVNKVFISDKFDESFLPRYLSFVKGVVDSSDLPLNVSREILQQSRVSRVMRKQLVKRTLDTLKDLSNKESKDGEDEKEGAGEGGDYKTFWEAFGRNLKLGVIEDQDNRETLGKLLRFYSSKSGDGMISLDSYVGNMKEGQKGIYYIAADSKEIAATSPFVEELLKRDYEILYLVEPIDEVCVSNLAKYDEKDMIDVSKEDLVLDDETEEGKKAEEERAEEYKALTDWMQEVLGDKVEKVVVSKRINDSPCILVTSKFGWSANMEKIMKSQAMGDNRAMDYMRGKKILEINPTHPIITSLKEKRSTGGGEGGQADEGAKSMVALMYETALLTSGFNIESPKDYATRVYEMIATAATTTTAGAGANAGGDAGTKSAAEGGAAKPEAVDAEVLPEDKSDDPWK